MDQIRATAKIRNPETGRIQSAQLDLHDGGSGARGSRGADQAAGMRGLMAKPSGEIIETPIISNFKEGCRCSSTSTRRTARARVWPTPRSRPPTPAILTRRLVDVAQDCIIVEEDCGTERHITLASVIQGGEVIEELSERILGRTRRRRSCTRYRRGPGRAQRAARRGDGPHPRRGGGGERAGALRTDLRQRGRRVQHVLWARSGAWHAGQRRRGGRRDRRGRASASLAPS